MGYEEHRRPGLWYTTVNGDVHVGRKKPRKGTGSMDRAAHHGHAFTRSDRYVLPGHYRISTRIKFTTSYVSGAVIFGMTRRDLNLRFNFSAGDLMYAIGESQEEPAFDAVPWSVSGRWTRDGALPGSVASGRAAFEKKLPAFDLDLEVEGPAVRVLINGDWAGTYHTVDGAPIEGHVGFASGYGAFIAQQPRVERLDRDELARGLPRAPGLDLASPRCRPFAEIVNLPFRGIERQTNGFIMAWIPMPWVATGETLELSGVEEQVRKAARKLTELLDRKSCPQNLVVALPAALGEARIAALKNELSVELTPPPRFATHAFPASIHTPDPVTPDGNRRWLFFVDTWSVIRVAQPLSGALLQSDFDEALDHWITVFRDHGRPPRELPEVKRFEEAEEAEEEVEIDARGGKGLEKEDEDGKKGKEIRGKIGGPPRKKKNDK